jgi:hypothetical protein
MRLSNELKKNNFRFISKKGKIKASGNQADSLKLSKDTLKKRGVAIQKREECQKKKKGYFMNSIKLILQV